MKVNKILLALLAAVLAAAPLSACSGQSQTESLTTSAPNADSTSLTSASSAQNASDTPQKLTELTIFAGMWGKASQNLKNYNENFTFQEMEKRTGVKVKWIHPPAGQTQEQFNLMIASQDLPDIIAYDWVGITGGLGKYVQDKVIIDLTPLMAEHAPNFMATMEKNPDARRQTVDDSGNYYALPMLRLDDKLRVTGGPQIRADWLEKLGLQKPTTVEDLHNVLLALRNGDPNGNGQKDEYPLTGTLFRHGNGIGMLCSAFGTSYDMYVDNGVVKFGPIQPEFKEAMTNISQWFAEDLIDPDYMLNDGTKRNARLTDQISAMQFAGQPTTLMRTMAESGKVPEFRMEGMNYIQSSDGVRYSIDPQYNLCVANPCTAITAKAKMPEQTLEWLDYAYGEEGNTLFNLGVEGESFTMVDGKPKYTEKVTANDNAGYASYHMALNGWSMAQDVVYHEQLMWQYGYPAAEFWKSADRSLVLPPITFTPEETKTVSRLKADIDTYVDEMCDKFTTGKASMADFDSYVETVKSMGIDELTALYQAAYTRYQAR